MISKNYSVPVVREEQIYDLDMDIYAPCALGATLNDDTIGRLKCQLLLERANNQCKTKQSTDTC